MTTAATATCPFWRTASHAPDGPHESSPVLLDAGDDAPFVNAFLTAPPGQPTAPTLKLEADADHRNGPLDEAAAARFADAVTDWARALTALMQLMRGDSAAASIVPGLLAKRQDEWWQEKLAEAAASRAEREQRAVASSPQRRHLALVR